MSSENTTAKKQQNDLDSILDAALDELDIENEDKHENKEIEDFLKQPRPVNSAWGVERKGDGEQQQRQQEEQSSKDVLNISEMTDDDVIASSMEGLMKQLMNLSETDGEGGVPDEKAFDELISQLQSQIPSDGQPKNPGPNTGNSADIQRSFAQQNPDDDALNVDGTVTKLLSDMAKLGASSEGMETNQFEQMGEDIMETMMKQFEQMGQKGDSDEAIDGMMKQLLSKELMYDPMKQITERFPAWLAENRQSLSEEDYSRYGHQYQYFQRIVKVYETDPDNFPRLMELMQDIQEYGQPPADIIKDLAPDLEFDEEGLPKFNLDDASAGMPFLGNEQCKTM